ncbi:MAG: DUF2088 domain-containing protein [bacterium]|nr:DUF2088 domain-containing protein [bacterium]
MPLPEMVTITQTFDARCIPDVEKEITAKIEQCPAWNAIKKGDSVAIGVGSRGIAHLKEIIRTVVPLVRQQGGEPFLFPAMGSHGGGTSEGQKEVLHSLGINRDSVGAEIRSDAMGIQAGVTTEGLPVFLDKNAMEADHVIVVNRIKPHTKFKGDFESGILKMLSIGIGKVQGATARHRGAVEFGFPRVIESVGKKAIEKLNFLLGIALLETPGKKIHAVSLLSPENIDEEKELLKKAFALLPRIPFEEIDLLIVDQIGKDISGTGMDTNVTGRNRDILGDFCMLPKVRRILVRDLTEKTKGNANGIGFADFTTRRLADKIDFQATYTNALAAMEKRGQAKYRVADSTPSLGMTEVRANSRRPALPALAELAFPPRVAGDGASKGQNISPFPKADSQCSPGRQNITNTDHIPRVFQICVICTTICQSLVLIPRF